MLKLLLQVTACVLLLAACSPSARLKNYAAYRVPQSTGTSIPTGKIKATFFGTSTLLLDDGETQLMVDGFITRPGIFKVGLGKIGCDTNMVKAFIARYHVNRLKAVFCAHSHYDHAMDAPYVCNYTGATLFGSASTLNIGRGAGLGNTQMQAYQTGVPLHFGNFTVTILPSRHTPPITVLGKSNNDLGVEITAPLQQPAKAEAYSEGGAFDILVSYNGHTLLVKPSTNYLPQALDKVQADVLFLGVACLGRQDSTFRQTYYAETVGKVGPQTVIPVHWDNFFKPLSTHLKALPKAGDNVKKGFNFLIEQTANSHIQFKLLQGTESILLF